MKKTLLVVMSLLVALTFTFSVSQTADAKRSISGGIKSYQSPKRSFSDTPSKTPTQNNISKTDTGKTTNPTSNTTNTPTNRGFFSGGSLLKGMFIGGLAGLLFGSLFSNFGALGDILGLLVNVLAIYAVFLAVRGLFRYMADKRKEKDKRLEA
ncbi:hypothetical protein [Ferviditalea candida]|uniref:Preprotein translocase subunit Tim44 n=1 Tax=Ferviditalea candida TaxID=3108399 RepID=A0ABU5ZM46_9BACL|nr:hypothetical protein [Paenibacillaceae bacterium T2]